MEIFWNQIWPISKNLVPRHQYPIVTTCPWYSFHLIYCLLLSFCCCCCCCCCCFVVVLLFFLCSCYYPLTYLPDIHFWPSYLTKETFSLIQTLNRAVSQFLRCFSKVSFDKYPYIYFESDLFLTLQPYITRTAIPIVLLACFPWYRILLR